MTQFQENSSCSISKDDFFPAERIILLTFTYLNDSLSRRNETIYITFTITLLRTIRTFRVNPYKLRPTHPPFHRNLPHFWQTRRGNRISPINENPPTQHRPNESRRALGLEPSRIRPPFARDFVNSSRLGERVDAKPSALPRAIIHI